VRQVRARQAERADLAEFRRSPTRGAQEVSCDFRDHGDAENEATDAPDASR
jgi:hypothetical protein